MVVSGLLALMVLHPWSLSVTDSPSFADPLWVQAMVTVHGQVGPFGVSDHLAYPGGASPWALPQLGLMIGVLSWLMVGLGGMSAVAFVYWLVVLVAALNAAALLFFLRGLVGGRMAWFAAVLSVTLAVAHWVLSFASIVNLTMFVILPVAVGVLLRWPGTTRRWRAAALGTTAAIAAVSPAWWVIVAALVLPWMVVAPAVRRRWAETASVLLVAVSVWLGLLPQIVMQFVSAGSMSDQVRPAWDSVSLAGGLLDLVRSSPAINELLPRLSLLSPGTSGDTPFGLGPGLLAGVAVVAMIAMVNGLGHLNLSTLTLASATSVSILYFLGGGLGAVQAGLAVLLGTESPARWWSRMLVVIAVMGAGWLLVIFVRWQQSGSRGAGNAASLAAVGVAGLLAVGWVADERAGTGLDVIYTGTESAQAVVDEIRDREEPCPVAQFPADLIPSSRVQAASAGTIYSGLLPYVLAPEFFWTAGSDDPPISEMPTELGAPDLAELRGEGFCAVVYDKELGRIAVDQGVEMPGAAIDPKLRADFANDRYSIFFLADETPVSRR